jgi:glycosyltransferase involved in cell wall biosynthesis
MKLAVIIPVYNEERTLDEILRRVAAVPIEKEILVVNDASIDGTRAVLDAIALPGLRVFHHPSNRGKGAAVRTALAQVRAEIVIIQDADLEYDPSEYPRLIAPIERGEADVVYGSRFLAGRSVTPFWHYFVNRTLTQLSNLFTGLRLTDMETCYKVFRADLICGLELVSDTFTIEPELTAKAARRGARFVEVPISYQGRGYEAGKKIDWRDGVRALVAIARFGWGARSRPRRG